MKAKRAANPISDAAYEFENGAFTFSGPFHYTGDLHPSFRIDGPDGIIASVFAFDGNIEAALERTDTMTAALARRSRHEPHP